MANDHKRYRIKGRSGKRTYKRQNGIDWTVIFTIIIYGNLKTMFTYLVFFFILQLSQKIDFIIQIRMNNFYWLFEISTRQ